MKEEMAAKNKKASCSVINLDTAKSNCPLRKKINSKEEGDVCSG